MSVGKSISEAADRMEKGETRSSLTNITNFVYTRQTAESGGGGGAEFIHLKHEMMAFSLSLSQILLANLHSRLFELFKDFSYIQELVKRLRDPKSWLPLATWVSSRNLS